MKYLHLILLSVCLGIPVTLFSATSNYTLRGTVTDSINGNLLTGVYVYFPELKKGGITDKNGEYVITQLPAVKSIIQVSLIGHQTIIQEVDIKSQQTLNFNMKENNALLGEVVVKGYSGNGMLQKIPTPISYVSHHQLEMTSSTNIIDAIAHEPGISQITTGGGISKPVIRGLGYNHIVVVDNGIRQEGQQWGDEHGIEIDPQSVYAVRILKGPASLMYGSDAMAGVIIFEDEPIQPEGKIKVSASTEYQTNNGLFDYSLNAAGNTRGNVWNLRYSDKMAHAYKNSRDGYVFNSAFREQALSGLIGINRTWGYSHLSFSHYHLTPGIIEGSRNDSTGAFQKTIAENGNEKEVDATHSDFISYNHFLPYQQVYHSKAVLDNSFLLGQGSLKILLAYQQNRRKEYEDVLTPDWCGLHFLLHTVNYDVHYLSPEWKSWKFSTGTTGMIQKSLNKGSEYLIPAYRLFDYGLFLTANKHYQKWQFSGGLRFDHRFIKGNRLIEDNTERFPDFKRNFSGFTGSLGTIYNLSKQSNLHFNLSRGFRAPNASELASNGEHEGTIRYELGNLNLQPEFNWQIDLGFDYSSTIVSTQVSLFSNWINHYIFAYRLTNQAGSPVMTDGWQTYQFTSGNARLMGGEFSIDFHPVEKLHWQNDFSYVNAVQLHQPKTTKYLPFTPVPRWNSEIKYDLIRDSKLLNNTYVALNFEYNLRQDHYYMDGGTETATPDYGLFGLSVGTDLLYHQKHIASLYINGTNLTNKAYQNHLSRLKYADFNPANGYRGVYNMGRNISFKLVILLE